MMTHIMKVKIKKEVGEGVKKGKRSDYCVPNLSSPKIQNFKIRKNNTWYINTHAKHHE